MASSNRQAETNASLSQEIKYLKNRCKETCDVIANNTPIEMRHFTSDNLDAKGLCYVDGLRAQLQASETPVVTDDNLVTGLYLTELDEKISQVQELIVYKNGLVRDVSAEILRLNEQIKMAEETKNVKRSDKVEVRPEHYQKAKQRFNMFKMELHNLIQTLFPNEADNMMEMLASLMKTRLDATSSGYIEITSDMFHLAEMLRDMGIVAANPYNKKEIKLAD